MPCRLQNSRVFFSKSVKKSVKRGVRVLRARSARASHVIEYAKIRTVLQSKGTVRIFSVSPQSRSLFSASFQTFCLTARAYLNTQKYGLFCSLNTMRYRLLPVQSTGRPISLRKEGSFRISMILLRNFVPE